MKLFKEIKRGATDSSKNLADVLRKTKIVASLLKNQELKAWINKELNGYYGTDGEDVPKYRKAAGQNLGHFSGPFGSGLNNANIPLSVLPDSIEKFASQLIYRQSVGELQSLAQSESNTFRQKWPADIILYLQHNIIIYEGMHIVDAWQVLTKAQVNAILDTIRTRLLDFILELEGSFPDLINSEQDLSKIPSQEVSNHFHTYITGNRNIVATGSSFKQEVKQKVEQNDFKSLQNYLAEIGVSESEITRLKDAIEQDEKPESSKKFGTNVSKWLGKITEKVVSGSIEIASKEGIMAISKAIATYYGLN